MYAIKNFREASTFRKRGLNATDILSMLLPRFTKRDNIIYRQLPSVKNHYFILLVKYIRVADHRRSIPDCQEIWTIKCSSLPHHHRLTLAIS